MKINLLITRMQTSTHKDAKKMKASIYTGLYTQRRIQDLPKGAEPIMGVLE